MPHRSSSLRTVAPCTRACAAVRSVHTHLWVLHVVWNGVAEGGGARLEKSHLAGEILLFGLCNEHALVDFQFQIIDERIHQVAVLRSQVLFLFLYA